MEPIKIPDPHAQKDFTVTHVTPSEVRAQEPGNKVKVNFRNFVHLVATHDVEGAMEKHSDEEIIVSTNLLTDLANAHEELPDERSKLPVYLIIGIVIGIVITYFITRF